MPESLLRRHIRLRRDLWRDAGVWLIGFVQSANNRAAATSVSVTLSAVGAGNALLCFNHSDGTPGSSTMSGGGVTWTRDLSSNNPINFAMFSGFNASGGATSVTYSDGAATYTHCICAEFSGLAGTLDGTGSGSGDGSGTATSITSASKTTTQASDLLFAGVVIGSTTAITLNDASASDIAGVQIDGKSDRAAYRILTSTGTYSINNWSWTGGTIVNTGIVIYKGTVVVAAQHILGLHGAAVL